jgi:propanol-preferring alcohol dehydrogenase
VAVAGIHSCGRCDFCVRGHDNACVRSGVGRGYGEDGGLAPYLVVPQRELVRLSTLDPREAAPLTDAGATSYHAVNKVRPKLHPGSVAVVIGVGGLGGYAVQYLRLLSGVTVVAVDVVPHRLEIARELGAEHIFGPDDDVPAQVRDLTAGQGAAGVFDFVAVDETARVALSCARAHGAIALVGAGGGTAPVTWGSPPPECEVFTTMGATIADLREVVALAEQGRLRIDIETFPFDKTREAYEYFRVGRSRGRVVVTL